VVSLSPSQRSLGGLGPPATAASASAVAEAHRSAQRRSAALAAGIAGTIATAATVWFAARSRVLVAPTELAVWRGLLVASYIAVGTYMWWRRPESRVGPLVAAAGFAYAITSMVASSVELVYTLGMVAWAATTVYVGYVYLCLPAGRLESGAKAIVMLKRDDRGIELTVSDDGGGMVRCAWTDGTGITGMRDRIESVGGQFEIVTAPGRGTSVRATIADGAA
jgi:hypothetical protein